jgi:hypothetical protein
LPSVDHAPEAPEEVEGVTYSTGVSGPSISETQQVEALVVHGVEAPEEVIEGAIFPTEENEPSTTTILPIDFLSLAHLSEASEVVAVSTCPIVENVPVVLLVLKSPPPGVVPPVDNIVLSVYYAISCVYREGYSHKYNW